MEKSWRTYHLSGGSTELVGGTFGTGDAGPHAVHAGALTFAVNGSDPDVTCTSFTSAGDGLEYVVVADDLDAERCVGAHVHFLDGTAAWKKGRVVDALHTVSGGDVYTVLVVDDAEFDGNTATLFVLAGATGARHGRVACWPFPESSSSSPRVAEPPNGGDFQLSWIANVVSVKRQTTLVDFGFSVVFPAVNDSEKEYQRDVLFFVAEVPNALDVVAGASSAGDPSPAWKPWEFDPADLFSERELPDGSKKRPRILWCSRVRAAERLRRTGGRPTDDSSPVGGSVHYEGQFAGASSGGENLHFVDLEAPSLATGAVPGTRDESYGAPAAVDLRSPTANVVLGPGPGCARPRTVSEGQQVLVGAVGFFEEAVRYGGILANAELVFDVADSEERASLEVAVVPFAPQPGAGKFARWGGEARPVDYVPYSRRVADEDDYWTKAVDSGGSPFDRTRVQESWWSQPEAVFAVVGSVGGRIGEMVWSESGVPFPVEPWRDGDWSRQWPRVQAGEGGAWTRSDEGEDLVESGTELRDLSEDETSFFVERTFLPACRPLDYDSGSRAASRSAGCWVSDFRWSVGDVKTRAERSVANGSSGVAPSALEPGKGFYNASSGNVAVASAKDVVLEVPYRGSVVADQTAWLQRAEAAGVLSSRRIDRAIVRALTACCDCGAIRWPEPGGEPAVTVSWKWGAKVGSAAEVVWSFGDDRALSLGEGPGASVSVSGPSAVPDSGSPWEDAESGFSPLSDGSIEVAIVGHEESSWGVARIDLELSSSGPGAWVGGSPLHELSGATLEYVAGDGSIREVAFPASPRDVVGASATGEFPRYGASLPLWRVDPGWSVFADGSFGPAKRRGAWGLVSFDQDPSDPVARHSGDGELRSAKNVIVPPKVAFLRARDSAGDLDPSSDSDYGSGTGATVTSVVAEADPGSPSFSVSGTYTGSSTELYVVEVTAEGTPDEYRFSRDGGITWEVEGEGVPGAPASIGNGLSISFGATTGYSVGDSYSFVARQHASDFEEGHLVVERSGPFREAWVSEELVFAETDGGGDTEYVFRFRQRASSTDVKTRVSFVWATGDVVQRDEAACTTEWETRSASLVSSEFPVGAERFRVVLEVRCAESGAAEFCLGSVDFYRGSSASYSPTVAGGCRRRREADLAGSSAFFAEGRVGAAEFSGSGLDDLTSGGAFSHPEKASVSYVVRVDGTGSPDTFRWSDTGGETWNATGVSMSSLHSLTNGVTVVWGATTGHTTGDEWSFEARAAARARASFFFPAPASYDPSELDNVAGATAKRAWLGVPGRTGTTLPADEGGEPSRALKKRSLLLVSRGD